MPATPFADRFIANEYTAMQKSGKPLPRLRIGHQILSSTEATKALKDYPAFATHELEVVAADDKALHAYVDFHASKLPADKLKAARSQAHRIIDRKRKKEARKAERLKKIAALIELKVTKARCVALEEENKALRLKIEQMSQ